MTATLAPDSPGAESLRPLVARGARSRGVLMMAAGAGAMGVIAFLALSQQRLARPARLVQPRAASPAFTPAAFPEDLAQVEAAARGQLLVPPTPPPTAPAPALPPPRLFAAATSPDPAIDPAMQQHLRSPAVIVDLGVPAPPEAAPAAGPLGGKPGGGGAAAGPRLSSEEQFSERVSAAEPDRVRASAMTNLGAVVPQGAIVPAVLETALNSDLPGFARAVVSRDVRGFDGSRVLIPRGSRLVGQYKNGVSQGQSRAFLIWTRLIRPDGVSIQIGSPATDTLGRAGLTGSVDRHFFEVFGGAFLLSVINSGTESLFRSSGNQIYVNSSQEAIGLAAASVVTPPTIPPTIKVAQGEPVRVFVARDLDFSMVGRSTP
jgi:type IV secretion system protein VirB10